MMVIMGDITENSRDIPGPTISRERFRPFAESRKYRDHYIADA
jgi:hypothetical protein